MTLFWHEQKYCFWSGDKESGTEREGEGGRNLVTTLFLGRIRVLCTHTVPSASAFHTCKIIFMIEGGEGG